MLGFLAAECTLRMLRISFLLPYQPDPHCGSRLTPGLSGWYREEGVAHISINEHGNRDQPHSVAKPADVFRIAVLGDSYCEAFQVNWQDTFWHQLELAANAPRHGSIPQIEVCNFGVSGYGTAQELQMLRHYVWAFEPDLVVLAFLTGNDISDNSPELGTSPPRPYFRLVDNQLVIDQSFLQAPAFMHACRPSTRWKVRFINASRVAQVVYRVKNNWFNPPSSNPPSPRLPAKQTSSRDIGAERGLDSAIYTPTATPAWQEAWDVTLALVQQMHLEVTQRNTRFCVVSLSNAIQVDPDPRVRQQFAQSLGIDDLMFPDKRLKKFCQSKAVPCILLAPPMAAEAERTDQYFHGFPNTKLGTGHWNADGHRFAGRYLAKALRDTNLVP